MSDRLRWVARGLGQTLITLGAVVLLFCVYELEITGLYTKKEQRDLGKGLESTWQQPPPPASDPAKALPYDVGKGIARIYFPTLGKDVHYVVVEGVGHDDLKKGPGHYPDTARPGALGNLVISGHRTTYLAPFNRIDELHPGDPIVVETQTTWFTYRVYDSDVVKPSAVAVTYPVPYHQGEPATKRLITLTTCNPKYSARTRLIVFGELQAPLAKGPGVLPDALKGRT